MTSPTSFSRPTRRTCARPTRRSARRWSAGSSTSRRSKRANEELIATIQESLTIADEGKARRAAAEIELQKMEEELKNTLASASARGDKVGDTAGSAVPS